MEAILNTSFDWNGIREPFIFATENDSLNGATMLFGHLLTDTAQIFADVRTYWSPAAVKRVTGHKLTGKAAGGILHLINSGAATLDATGRKTRDGKSVMKPFWEITPEEVEACLEATQWGPAMLEYFRGGGYSSQFLTCCECPATMARINWITGQGPVLQLAEGYTVALPPKVNKVLDERTNPTWPTTWFAPLLTGRGPFRDVYSVMNNWGANHGAICYGHIGDKLISSRPCCAFPCACITWAKKESSGPAPGPTSGRTIPRAPTTAPARTTARCTEESEWQVTGDSLQPTAHSRQLTVDSRCC